MARGETEPMRAQVRDASAGAAADDGVGRVVRGPLRKSTWTPRGDRRPDEIRAGVHPGGAVGGGGEARGQGKAERRAGRAGIEAGELGTRTPWSRRRRWRGNGPGPGADVRGNRNGEPPYSSRPSALTGKRVPSSKVRKTSRSEISWPAGGVAVTEMLSVCSAVRARSALVTVVALLSATPVFTPCARYPVTVRLLSMVHCSPWTAPGDRRRTDPVHVESSTRAAHVVAAERWSGDPQVDGGPGQRRRRQWSAAADGPLDRGAQRGRVAPRRDPGASGRSG